ncbi:uncharacterized protein A4U43_C06F7600 [Asparagus officinalis]|uniref:KIB1-4 beta-propeller domain-containing protein n=1 Tax=Asparagus officinalis TaxID=4686 RepID=A0A5P1EPC1_ASPOF|nr:putative F-box protein At5g55150 [Asparagus officinalis]ONK66411.1 uncharacterized protein A4U43_C06F7600 [Asparagus officinalis]
MSSLDRLPIDILELIAEKLADHAGLLRFGDISRKFRSIVVDNLHLLPSKLPLCLCVLPSKPPPLPLLMQCRDNEWEMTNFFSLSTGRNHGEFFVPEIRNKWPAGSSHGWLCIVNTHGRDIQLLNPLTRVQIPLPSLDAFEHPKGGFADGDHDDFGFVEKAVISSDPSKKRGNLDDDDGDDRILVMAIISLSHVLSFCMIGDDKWTNVEDSPLHLTDVVYYKGQIYAVNYEGIVVVYDFSGDKKMKQIANSPDFLCPAQRYLVESTCGDLLQVVWVYDFEGTCKQTSEFLVYKLEAVDELIEPEEYPVYYTIGFRKPEGQIQV